MPTQLHPHPVGRLPEEWRAWALERGEKPFRAAQIFRWIHERGELDVGAMSNLPAALREALRREGWSPPVEVAQVRRSRDGTRKLLVRLGDGLQVECVVIPMSDREAANDADAAACDDEGVDDGPAGGDRRGRVTLCISSQVGCAMGCVFCASGKAGLQRGLTAAEIVSQVLVARRYLDEGEYVRNLVFMGMGEPLHHYDETSRAIRLLTHPDGSGMSPRRITVSTVGLPRGIRRLGEDFQGKVGLAISLHAPTSALRSEIIPMNDSHPLPDLIAALRAYPLPRRRRITIEYTLLAGKNDSVAHAEELAGALAGLRVKVNLIPVNPIEGGEFSTPGADAVEAFRRCLASRRVSCSVRVRRGDDVDAACGQLALQGKLVKLARNSVRDEPVSHGD